MGMIVALSSLYTKKLRYITEYLKNFTKILSYMREMANMTEIFGTSQLCNKWDTIKLFVT